MFRKKRSRTLTYVLFFFILILGINKFFLPFSDLLRYSYSVILHPIFLSQEYLVNPVKKVFAERKSRKDLEKLVYKLSRVRDNIIAENINLRATVSYYNQIKEVLEFKRKYDIENLLFCKILFKYINQNSHFIYIDKGFANGIEVDMVAVYNNFLLGKVVETYKFYSKVLLVTDKSCKVSAYCEITGANGINEGVNLPDQMALNRISHLEQVQVDDIVLSSGHGLVFPQGFALGKVVSVQKGDLYNTVKVAPMFDIKNIDYCFLLKKGDYKGQANQVEPVDLVVSTGMVETVSSVEPVINSKQTAKKEPNINPESALQAKPTAKAEQVAKVEYSEKNEKIESVKPAEVSEHVEKDEKISPEVITKPVENLESDVTEDSSENFVDETSCKSRHRRR